MSQFIYICTVSTSMNSHECIHIHGWACNAYPPIGVAPPGVSVGTEAHERRPRYGGDLLVHPHTMSNPDVLMACMSNASASSVGAVHSIRPKTLIKPPTCRRGGVEGGGGSCYPPFVGGRLRAYTSRPEVFVEMQTARAGHASGPTGPRWLGFVTC
jgi:hypothetical protein